MFVAYMCHFSFSVKCLGLMAFCSNKIRKTMEDMFISAHGFREVHGHLALWVWAGGEAELLGWGRGDSTGQGWHPSKAHPWSSADLLHLVTKYPAQAFGGHCRNQSARSVSVFSRVCFCRLLGPCKDLIFAQLWTPTPRYPSWHSIAVFQWPTAGVHLFDLLFVSCLLPHALILALQDVLDSAVPSAVEAHAVSPGALAGTCSWRWH